MPAGRPKPEEIAPKRSKRAQLIDAASQAFNARGVSQASLTEIGERLGVTRAALYYYAEGREDLLFQCYRHACEVEARDLEAASKVKGGALARITHFVRARLDPERPETASLCETALLEEEPRETIEGLRQANLARLIDMIEAGQKAGALRRASPRVVAEAIAGMIAWVPLAQRWAETLPDVARAREAVLELLSRGIAARPVKDMPEIDLACLRAPAGSLFDRDAAAAMKTEEVLRAASRLFNRNGIDSTSLDEVAAAIGATKGAVYHYLADKPALVARCYHRAWDMSERAFEISRAHNGDGLSRALIAFRLLTEINLREEFSPLAPFVGFEALTSGERAKMRKRVRTLGEIYPADAERGVADGSVRAIDLRAVAGVSAGAFGWLPKWAHDQDELAHDAIAEELTRLFAIGLEA
ncbi:MAG: TetR/AcrR family transcriptional regulator [Hyphomonadaceae bacterium]